MAQEGAAAWLPLLEQGRGGSAFPESMRRVILHCWKGHASCSGGPLSLCVPWGGMGADPHSRLCPLSWGNVPGAGGSKMSLQHFYHLPRSSPTRGAVRKVREGWQHEGGHVKPQHFNHLPPAAPKLIAHHLRLSLAMEKSCSGFSNELRSSHESCWAFLWEMKSSLTLDHLSPMKWLKCYTGGTSGAPLNLLGRLRASATPLQSRAHF